ncbi:MAG: DAK2 domain-containing protein [Ruminococcaceae bacterium]|nr:DAK2 domain-containing protein [Oscillospiraceae bacterium]
MLTGSMLKQAIISGANNICSQKERINDLNIFPVPDGDTGTNMSMTITAAITALKDCDSDNAGEVAKVVASAMLRGARGNSGVILSLLFRGFAKGLEGKAEASGKDLVKALGIGVDAAYKAVMKPTEGTILTVAREAFEEGAKAVKKVTDPAKVWSVVCKSASESLDRTPELLPVLKKAGVVDAGGKGLLVIFEGMLSFIKNGKMIEYAEADFSSADTSDDTFRNAAAEFDEVINFTYCTEFIVGRDASITTSPLKLRAYLETIGDCVVVVDDDEIIKVHVHTEDPGKALQRGLQYGQLLTVKVENMRQQHEQQKASNAKSEKKLEVVAPEEEIGFVSVASGDGLTTLFKDLGCTHVVSGGQSMNPSTDDIYEAVMATPAKTVFVLPNNKNIIMAAEQTAKIVEDREVIILPTKTIPQGISAMLAFDPDSDAVINKGAMQDAFSCVSTGQITFAARDSEFGMKKIKEGDIIGLDNGKLTVADKTPKKAILKLAKNMIDKDAEFVTLIYGAGISEKDAQEVYDELVLKYGNDVDINMIDGGQPIYYYILGVESSN